MTNHNSPQPTEQPDGEYSGMKKALEFVRNIVQVGSRTPQLSHVIRELEMFVYNYEPLPSPQPESVDALGEGTRDWIIEKAVEKIFYSRGGNKATSTELISQHTEEIKSLFAALASHPSPSVDAEPSPQPVYTSCQSEPDAVDMIENAGPNREPDWHRKRGMQPKGIKAWEKLKMVVEDNEVDFSDEIREVQVMIEAAAPQEAVQDVGPFLVWLLNQRYDLIVDTDIWERPGGFQNTTAELYKLFKQQSKDK